MSTEKIVDGRDLEKRDDLYSFPFLQKVERST